MYKQKIYCSLNLQHCFVPNFQNDGAACDYLPVTIPAPPPKKNWPLPIGVVCYVPAPKPISSGKGVAVPYKNPQPCFQPFRPQGLALLILLPLLVCFLLSKSLNKGREICIAPLRKKLATEALRHGSHSFCTANTPCLSAHLSTQRGWKAELA